MEGVRERRARLSDLPDDLLIRIFTYVRRQTDNDCGYSRASHHWPVVSKKFRAISCKPELSSNVRLKSPRNAVYRWLTAREAGLKTLSVVLAPGMGGPHYKSLRAAQMLGGLVQDFSFPEFVEDLKVISRLQRLSTLSLDTSKSSDPGDDAQEAFAGGLAELTGLQTLKIGNSCFRVPDTASSLCSLSRLVLTERHLGVELPASISKLTRLAVLVMSSLAGSLSQLGNFSSLRFLCLAIKREMLPRDEEGVCDPLRHLSALRCVWWPGDIELQGEEELLSLIPAQMRSLKYAIFENFSPGRQDFDRWQPFSAALLQRLPNLKVLSLAKNGLSELPPGITALLHLEHLCLHGNQLPEVPQLLRSLTMLTHLDMSCNPNLQLDKEGVQRLRALPQLQLLKMAKRTKDSTPNLSRTPEPNPRWDDQSVHWLTVLAKEGAPLDLLSSDYRSSKGLEVKAIDLQGKRSYQVYYSGRLL